MIEHDSANKKVIKSFKVSFVILDSGCWLLSKEKLSRPKSHINRKDVFCSIKSLNFLCFGSKRITNNIPVDNIRCDFKLLNIRGDRKVKYKYTGKG